MSELRLSRWFAAAPEPGETRTVAGEYTLVERPRRLVHTWRWEGMPTETVVTVDFHADGDGTRVELHQAGFPDEHDRAHGWAGCPDDLARRVFPGA